jgi:predicted transcriptional regulator
VHQREDRRQPSSECDKVTPVVAIVVLEKIMSVAVASPITHSIAKTVSVKLDKEIRERIQQLANIRDRSTHWIMREAIQQYVEREEKRETFRRDTLNAWKEYQETGLHATGDEVIAWLETWGEENEQAAPVCHK